MHRFSTRLIAAAAALLVALAMSFSASASPPGHTFVKRADQSRFYIFDGGIIRASMRGPGGTHFTGRERIKFMPLLKLKKSFRSQFATAHMDPRIR